MQNNQTGLRALVLGASGAVGRVKLYLILSGFSLRIN